jgi:hypothetical protein
MSTRTVSCLFLGLNDGSAAMGFKVKPLTHGRPTFSLPSCSFFCLPVDIQHRVEEEENLFLYIILFKLQQSSSCVNIFVQYSPLYFPFSWARVSRSGWDRYITSTSEIDQKKRGGNRPPTNSQEEDALVSMRRISSALFFVLFGVQRGHLLRQ